MAQKLTKETLRRIERAMYHVKRAHAFLQGKDTAVCRPGYQGEMQPINKEIGSDLCGLEFAIRELESLWLSGHKD